MKTAPQFTRYGKDGSKMQLMGNRKTERQTDACILTCIQIKRKGEREGRREREKQGGREEETGRLCDTFILLEKIIDGCVTVLWKI